MLCFDCNCSCRCSCNVLVGISALIIGIVTAFLRITAVITVTPVFLWVALGIAVGFLAIVLATVPCRQCYNGGCSSLALLLFGVLTTALLAGILLAIPLAATSVVGAILTGLLLFTLSLTLGTAACLSLARCHND